MPCATWIAGGAAAAKTLGPKNCILWGYMWVPKCIWLNDSNMDVSWCCYAFGKPDILANCQLFVLLSNWISQSHRGTAAPEVPSFDDRDRSSHGVHRQIPPGPSSFFAMDRHRSLRRLQNGVWYFDALGTGYVSLEKWRKSRTLQAPHVQTTRPCFLEFWGEGERALLQETSNLFLDPSLRWWFCRWKTWSLLVNELSFFECHRRRHGKLKGLFEEPWQFSVPDNDGFTRRFWPFE